MTSKSAESSQPFQLHRSHPTSLAMSRSAAQQIKLSGNSPLEISSTFEVPDAQLSMGLLMNGWKIGPPMDHELWKTCSTKKMGPYEATFFYNPLLWDNKHALTLTMSHIFLRKHRLVGTFNPSWCQFRFASSEIERIKMD